jgi:hypothetical protein
MIEREKERKKERKKVYSTVIFLTEEEGEILQLPIF